MVKAVTRSSDTLLTIYRLSIGKKVDGSLQTWSIDEIRRISSVITEYINVCYERQSTALDEINMTDDQTLVDISVGWPSKEITL